MPAGNVRPRASLVPPLGTSALDAYRLAGWQITANGHIDLGQRVGPCARCQEQTVLYGPTGQPLCPACRPNPGGTEPKEST